MYRIIHLKQAILVSFANVIALLNDIERDILLTLLKRTWMALFGV
jgi:hypothetical protein